MLYTVLTQLRLYLGDWGVGILATMLFIVIIRIGIAFVFKLFRLNIDYNSLNHKNKAWKEIAKKDVDLYG